MNDVSRARDIEQRTRQIGRAMFERMDAARPRFGQAPWFEERGLQLLMQDERLKTQAFRFIDVLPSLSDAREIARHLREYFAGGESNGGHGAPRARRAGGHGSHDTSAALRELEGRPHGSLRRVLRRLLDFERLDGVSARLWAALARFVALRMARRFIAGTTVEQAERTIRRMRRQRLAFTIDVLGEAAVSQAEAQEYQHIYVDLIGRLPRFASTWDSVPQIDRADGRDLPRVNVSVKLTSLAPGMDAIAPQASGRAVKERLRPLLRQAMADGTHVHIDMEHYAVKDLTLLVFQELLLEDEFRDYPHFGIVLQTYLKDGERDAAALVEWARRRGTPVWVRVVKGAYWDTESIQAAQRGWPCPVWEQKWQSDACYERVVGLLLSNHEHTHVAAAGHNVRSLSHAMALREALGVPGWAFELQMLYGMGDPIKRAAVELGQRVRIYTPYGQLLPGMAYLIRRLLENTANESFLRHAVEAGPSRESLLRNPAEVGAASAAYEPPVLLRFEFEEPIMDPFENEPDTDFADARLRERMRAGLEQARSRMGREIPLVIGGRRLRGSATLDWLNPSRPAEVVARVQQAGAEMVDPAVAAAVSAQRQWREVPADERAGVLFRAADEFSRRRYELAGQLALECGRPWRDADAELSQTIDFCRFYGKELLRVAENVRRRDLPGESNEYFYAPLGVVAVLCPWNAPLATPTGMAAAAIVTGNAVVLKPSGKAAGVGYSIVEAFESAGLPTGVLNFLPGPGAVVGAELVRHPRVDMIAFAGSRAVGCEIYRLAAQQPTARPGLKKVIADLGGCNAILVDADADLDEAVRGVLGSAFASAGQLSSACSRCIVLDGVYDRFLSRLVEAARGLVCGPADEPTCGVPPLIDAAAQRRVRERIAQAKASATCALEVDASAAEREWGGYFVGPTIFTEVPADHALAREGACGPVLAILRARDIKQAIEWFNGSDFALAGGIYSRSPANIEAARRRCDCGSLFINRRITGARVDLQPPGGLRMSGLGAKAGGPDYLVQFCEMRCISENTLRRGFAPAEAASGGVQTH